MNDFGYSEEGKIGSVGDIRLWGRILVFCARYRLALTGAVVLSMLVTGASLVLPTLMQTGIDRYIASPSLGYPERTAGLLRIGIWYGLLVAGIFIASFLQVVLLEWIGQSVMHLIRQKMFSHTLELDLPYFNAHPTGRLVTRLTNDISNMTEMFTSVVVTVFNDLLQIAGIMVVLFTLNRKLALLMSVFVPLAALLTLLFANLAREQFRAIRSQLAKLNSFLQEAISGMSILQLFGRQERSRHIFESMSGEYMRRNMSQVRLFGVFMPLTDLMGSAATALILWYGGGEIIRRELSLGELVAFISYMRLFFQPLRELSQKYSIVQSAMASAERIFELLDTQRVIALPAAPVVLPQVRGELCFDRVNFSYDTANQILHDISLRVPPGRTYALVGTTGSGKTTLVNLLLRFYAPGSGTITIDGVDIADLEQEALRQAVGVILQDVFLLQDSLLANIIMDTGSSREKVEEIMKKTGMSRFVERLPHGLDTLIGEGGQELSSGEKQLLAFARVLCRNPAILVLDEATAAIDTESENILERAIADSFRDRTSLVVAHRLSTIRRADRILVMESGRIIEQGTHADLLAAGGHYADLVAIDLSQEG
ncbi:MAG: ABC transporter ATP-binding protein [Desulfocapsaceae bacterium]|nr:ABC transporter ATP-binding protein [Desulfocapsaceae bacterium]